MIELFKGISVVCLAASGVEQLETLNAKKQDSTVSIR